MEESIELSSLNGSLSEQSQSNTSLFRSICAKKRDQIVTALEKGANPNTQMDKKDDSLTPLVAACHFGDVEMIELLEFYGAQISPESRRPLSSAIIAGNDSVATYLMDCMGKDNLARHYVYAYMQNNEEVEKKINTYIADKEMSPYITNIVCECFDTNVSYSKEEYANILKHFDHFLPKNILDACLRDAIPWHKTNNEKTNKKKVNFDKIKNFIEMGANYDLQNGRGETPLYIASAYGNVDMVKFLLSLGANLNITDKCNQTPLYIASKNRHVPVVRLLLAADVEKVNLNVQNNRGETPLYIASSYGWANIVCLLLSKKANINLTDHNNQTPLYIACEKQHTKAVKLLLEAGADLNTVSKKTGKIARAVVSSRSAKMKQIFWEDGIRRRCNSYAK